MPKFGCYKMLVSEPDRTWSADYIAHKAGQVEFWNRATVVGEKDILVAVALLERGQTISEAKSTEVGKTSSIYQAIFDRSKSQEVYDYTTGTLLASPSE